MVEYVAKRTELEAQYATRDATTGVVILKSDVTFPVGDIGLTTLTAAGESASKLINDLAEYQLYESWYCGYTKFSKSARVLTFNITPTQAALYPISAQDINVNNLDKEDQERIVYKAHSICTAVGTGSFSAKQMLILSYENPSSSIKDIAGAIVEAAKTVTGRDAKCLSLALKLNNFVNDKRLSDYGLDLPYYAARWWSDEDTVVALIYAEVQNSLDLAAWDTTTVAAITTADATYTKLDKPKKALRFAVKVLTDLATFTWSTNTQASLTANRIDTSANGELVKKGFTVADLTRHGINEARAKVIETYMTNYITAESLAHDVMDTPKANGNANLDTDAKKIREIVLYQNQVYVDQSAEFGSVYLDFAAVGISRTLVGDYFDEHLINAEEFNRILVAAKAYAVLNTFPSATQIAYGFKTLAGVAVTAVNVATTVGKSQLAG